jgi:hypothetical protein
MRHPFAAGSIVIARAPPVTTAPIDLRNAVIRFQPAAYLAPVDAASPLLPRGCDSRRKRTSRTTGSQSLPAGNFLRRNSLFGE